MDPLVPPAAVPRDTYHRLSRTATYGFLSALPLLLLYEVMILVANAGHTMQVRVGAEVWVKQLLLALGGAGTFALGVVVLLIGLGIFFYERKKDIPIRPRYFAWILGESAVYAILVAILVSNLVGFILSVAVLPAAVLPAGVLPAGMVAPQASDSLFTMLALSIGAGLYEELIFRVVLVGGLYLVLTRFTDRRVLAYTVAAVIGAFLFSAVHYTGALGDVFTLSSFLFRFLFGLALNVIFLLRGFGVAAWTHALYDVLVVTHLLG